MHSTGRKERLSRSGLEEGMGEVFLPTAPHGREWSSHTDHFTTREKNQVSTEWQAVWVQHPVPTFWRRDKPRPFRDSNQDYPVPSTITIPTKQSDFILKYIQKCSANNINLNANYDYTNVIILIGNVFTFISYIHALICSIPVSVCQGNRPTTKFK